MHIEYFSTIPYGDILYRGISEEAFKAKGLPPMRPFSFFLKDQNEQVMGGISGTLFYGSI
jgi:hypothetical protein